MSLFTCVFFILLSVSSITVTRSDEFYCWSEQNRNTLTFTNNNSNIMKHLPTIRFIQGYWASQWALQYVGYLYLKEKLGINVEFFPKLSSGLTLSDLTEYEYPFFYWDHLEHNDYDLLLEMWPQAGVNDYYDRGTVIYGGNNDIYGEIGWFIPEYVYKEMPSAIVLNELKHNNILRQAFIDAYTINSNKDWVKYINDTLYNDAKLLETYLSFGYQLPTYSQPIVWGSNGGYVMSQYSANLTKYLKISNDTDIGLDWVFIPLGSESLLSEFVIDLYNNKQPFIANIYSPHTDFSTTSELTSDYMKFERVGLQRNTDNSRDAVCYTKDYQCREPLSPLFKLGNAALYDTFPEITAFLFDFNLLAEDLNNIIAYHRESNNWMNATCKWLLENDNKISEWFQDIIRYDCSGLGGCGFNDIGGYCANSTIESKCICTDKYLGGIDCRTHCPGLIGPILNTSNDTYYFEQCSNHGVCDIIRWSCECDAGYGGDGCNIVYKQFSFYNESVAVFIIWIILLSFIIFLNVSSVLWMWLNVRYKSVKLLAVRMTTLFSCGQILLCIGTIFYLIQPSVDNYNIICNFRLYCYGIGAVLTLTCPLLKAYRVHIIFNQAAKIELNKKKQIRIPDTKLIIYLINAMIIQLIVCIIYTIVLDTTDSSTSIIYLPIYYRIEYHCNHNYLPNLLWTTNIAYIFLLITMLTFFSIKNRKIKLFIESKCQFFNSILCLFLFIIVIIFYSVTDDTFVLLNIQCASIIICLFIIWCLFYGKIIFNFYKYPQKRTEWSTTTQTKLSTKNNKSTKNKKNNSEFEGSKSRSQSQSNNIKMTNLELPQDIQDQYDYPYNERTIKYDNDASTQIKHTSSISLTPTAAVAATTAATAIFTTNSKKQYKNNINNLSHIVNNTKTNNNVVNDTKNTTITDDDRP